MPRTLTARPGALLLAIVLAVGIVASGLRRTFRGPLPRRFRRRPPHRRTRRCCSTRRRRTCGICGPRGSLCDTRRARFFLPAFSAKLTEARGVWDAQQGAELEVDAYLVPDAQTEAESGIYLGMQSVITVGRILRHGPFLGRMAENSRNPSCRYRLPS